MNCILNAFIWASEGSNRWLGNRFEDAAELLEDTAKTLRWLSALTRVVP